AVAYVTDREAVRRVAFQETGRLATHPLGGGWAFNAQLDSEGYTLDLDKAKEALARSGYAGQPLTFTNSNDRLTQNIAQILQTTYTKAGLNVSLESVPAADSLVASRKARPTGPPPTGRRGRIPTGCCGSCGTPPGSRTQRNS